MAWSVLLLFFVVVAFVVVALTVNLFSGSHLSFSWRLLSLLICLSFPSSSWSFESFLFFVLWVLSLLRVYHEKEKGEKSKTKDNTQSEVEEEKYRKTQEVNKKTDVWKKGRQGEERMDEKEWKERKRTFSRLMKLESVSCIACSFVSHFFESSSLLLFPFTSSWILSYLEYHPQRSSREERLITCAVFTVFWQQMQFEWQVTTREASVGLWLSSNKNTSLLRPEVKDPTGEYFDVEPDVCLFFFSEREAWQSWTESHILYVISLQDKRCQSWGRQEKQSTRQPLHVFPERISWRRQISSQGKVECNSLQFLSGREEEKKRREMHPQSRRR